MINTDCTNLVYPGTDRCGRCAGCKRATEQVDAVKLRMKVWVDPEGKRWLVAGAMTTPSSLARKKPLKAYAMRDAEVKLIDLTHDQYNAMPYSLFIETERNVKSPGARTQDVVDL